MPLPNDRPHVILSVPAGSPRVCGDHPVAGARIHLELVEETVPVLRRRAAVDIHQSRHRIAPRRQVDPSLDGHPIVVDGEPLRLNELGHLAEPVVQRGDVPLLPVLPPVHLTGVGWRCRDEHCSGPIGPRADPGDRPIPANDFLNRAILLDADNPNRTSVLERR